MGLLLFFLNILLPYVLYTRLEALTGIRPLHMIYCLPTTFFAAGISAEKSVSMCLEGHISSCFRARLCISTESSLFFPLSYFSHKMRNNSHSIWTFVCCRTFNFKPDIFHFLFISFPGLFQTLVYVSSILFLYITLFFSPSSFLTVKKISPCLLTWCIALSGSLLHVEAVFKSLVSSSEHTAAHQLFSH